MKKFLFVITFLFFASTSFGQWSVGPRLGVNFATLTGTWSEHDDSKGGWVVGPVAGAVGSYGFSDMLSLNAELLYVVTGTKTKYTEIGERSTNEDYTVTFNEHYNYLQMPILVRATFGSNFAFYANAGPYFAYKIGGKYKAESNGNVTKGKIRFKEDKVEGNDWYFDPEYSRRFDFGIYIGGGAGKKVGPGVLEVDLRLGIGLLDHNKFSSKEAKTEAKNNGYKAYKTMMIGLTVAYIYPFGTDQPARFID